MKSKICFSILSLIFGINSLIAQDLYMQDFSIPICGNGNGQDTLNFYESYNGAYNDCSYKVTLATLFTSWWGICWGEAPLVEEIYQTYKNQGLEVVAFGADWDEPYSCEEWVSVFDLTYPIADFETGLPNWYQEDIPFILNMPTLGWGLPYNIIIDHNMQIIWGGVIDIAEGDNMAEAIEVLEGALEQLQPFVLDDDLDGTANQCDNCTNSHLYVRGDFDFSEELLIDGLDYGYYPSIEVFDVLLLADLVASGEEISPCFIEASDFTGDNTLDLIDVLALAQYVAQGN